MASKLHLKILGGIFYSTMTWKRYDYFWIQEPYVTVAVYRLQQFLDVDGFCLCIKFLFSIIYIEYGHLLYVL